MEEDLDLQEMPKLIPISKKNTKEENNCNERQKRKEKMKKKNHESPLCIIRIKRKKKTMKKKKRPKVNLSLSHVNHTMFYIRPSNWNP